MARKKSNLTGPTYYTTFQVARLLGVSPPAVVNWVNAGLLPAHRTPGGHRRITAEDLAEFARVRQVPLPADLTPAPAVSSRRVLVVDDERDFSEMIKDYLGFQGGYEVEVADSGFAAGLTVARFRPHIILMDIMMPDMDGFEALRMLRTDPDTQGIPVIACTAVRDPQIEDRIWRLFDGYVQKPVKLDDLARLLAMVTRRAEATATTDNG